jgi:hypothetical protein
LSGSGSSLSVVGIIGIILFALAFTSTIGGIILRKGGKIVSTKLMITSLVILFVTTLIFIMIIISKPTASNANVSLIWGPANGKENPVTFSFNNYGWSVLVITILGGVGMVGSFIPLFFKKHNSLVK